MIKLGSIAPFYRLQQWFPNFSLIFLNIGGVEHHQCIYDKLCDNFYILK